MDSVSFHSSYLSAPTSPFECSPQNPKFYTTRSTPAQPCSNAFNDEFRFETGWDCVPARVNSLKLPPRLQTSVPTSPTRSLSSRVRNPFPRHCTWNDGFDPFMIALEKVSEETEGRMSVHRRSRSYSPFRPRASISSTVDHELEKEPTRTGVMDRKGSMYSNWVRTQPLVKAPTPRTTIKRLWLGRRVRNADITAVKPAEPTSCKESKMKKVKSVLLRYTFLKKTTRQIITVSKVYLSNRRKKESADAKLPRCLVYTPVTPKWL